MARGRNTNSKKKSIKNFDLINLINLRSYLDCFNYEEGLPLSADGAVSFHWADCSTTCHYQRDQVVKNERAISRYKALCNKLEKLREVPVWLRTGVRHVFTDLYQVYEYYSDARVRSEWLKKNGNDPLISLTNESGPYVTIASLKWLDSEIYRLFILKKILSSSFPLRDFRISTNIPVNCYFEDNELSSLDAVLHQITDQGIIIKLKGSALAERLIRHNYLNVELPMDHFKDLAGMSELEMITKMRNCEFNQNMNEGLWYHYKISKQVLGKCNNWISLNNHGTADNFLFIGHQDLVPSSLSIPHESELLRPVVSKVRQYICESLKLAA